MLVQNLRVVHLLSLFVVTLGTATQPCLAADTEQSGKLNQLTAAEKAEGWQLLFDGETTQGWRNYRKEVVGAGWKVVDGALTRVAKGAGDIITEEQYDAFELLIDFKISPEGNSGIMYHVTEREDTPWQSGPEIQINDNVNGHDPVHAGWLYQLYKADIDAANPAGEWNQLRIIISPEKCVHAMNGKKYFEYVKGSDDWNQRVAASKFSIYPRFGKAKRGHICLQDHGDEVAYRAIKIKKLPLSTK